MATYWHKVSSDKLEEKIEEIKKGVKDCAVVEAEAVNENNGAFVLINSKEDAEKILLHHTLIIVGKKKVDGYQSQLKNNFKQAVFISAESKTADIEKKLVSGVHGAKECHFVVVENI